MTEENSGDRPRARDLALPLRWLVGGMFATIVILTIAQVFFRFALDSPLVWSEELSRLLLVWVTFIGAAVVAWDGRHLVVDVMFIRLPARVREVVRWFNLAVTIAFLVILSWFSIELVKINNFTEMGALPLPGSAVTLPATVGGILILVLVLARRFYRLPRERDESGQKKPTSDTL
ncbi:MAG: TRAP transporter small permease [Alphaproteobacteria bacterium]